MKSRALLGVFALLSAMLLLAGCGTLTPAVLNSIQLSPASPVVLEGSSQQLTANGSYNDGSAQDITSSVTWSSSNSSVATVSPTGMVTAVGGGTATITATSGTVSASVTVTVAALQSITVTPSDPTVTHSATQQFTATGNYSNGSTNNLTSRVTWASSDTAVATISAAGLATTKGAGQTTITGSLNGVSGSTTLTVNPPVLQSISVTPGNPTITHSATQQFTATGHYSDNTTQDLTASAIWSSSAGTVASIDASGLATSVGAGQTTITATSGSISGSTLLTVNPPAVTSIVVTPADPTVTHSATRQFTATGTFTNGSTQDITATVTWTSSNTSVASIDASGLATTTGTAARKT